MSKNKWCEHIKTRGDKCFYFHQQESQFSNENTIIVTDKWFECPICGAPRPIEKQKSKLPDNISYTDAQNNFNDVVNSVNNLIDYLKDREKESTW